MRMKLIGISLVLGLACLMALPGPSAAQSGARFFPETGYRLQGGFLDFWQTHGAYAVFGPPISDERGEVDAAGRPYTDQYLANAVLEYHPDRPAGARIILAPLGQLRYAALYPGILPPMRNNTSPGVTAPRFFPATGRWLGGGFLNYWLTHDGPELLGTPLSGEFSEDDPVTGAPHNVQYFERGELQWRPELAGSDLSPVQPLPLGRLWLPRVPAPGPPAVIQSPPLPPAPPLPPLPPAPPPTRTPVPPPPTPVPPRWQGQVLRFAGIAGMGQLLATVTGLREDRSLAGNPATGKFVTVFWRVQNVGGSTEAVGSHTVVLQDIRGRVFAPAQAGAQMDARLVFHRHIYFTAITPGSADDELLVFDVPADATNFALLVQP